MQPLGNDRWREEFPVSEPGVCLYAVEAWIDRFELWPRGFAEEGSGRTSRLPRHWRPAKNRLRRRRDGPIPWMPNGCPSGLMSWLPVPARRGSPLVERALDPLLARRSRAMPSGGSRPCSECHWRVVVYPERARFSAGTKCFRAPFRRFPDGHGTFKDCEAQLDRASRKWVLTCSDFPPIHPIGRSFRKGKNNNPVCLAGEPGSPWAIGAAEGGHKAMHPAAWHAGGFPPFARQGAFVRS